MYGWTEMLTFSYRLRARTVWILLRMSMGVGLEKGTVCVQRNADYLLENLSCENNKNFVNWKLEPPDDVFFSVYLLIESQYSFTQ